MHPGFHSRAYLYCVLAFVAAGIAMLALPPFYDTNDDVFLRMVAARELYPFNPAPELPLFLDVSVLYGHLVAGLAKAGLGWRAFDVAMVTLTLATLCALVFALLPKQAPLSAEAILIALLFAAIPTFVCVRQFTIVSIMAAGVGFALIARSASLQVAMPTARWLMVWGVIFVIIGGSIRGTSAMLTAGLMLPLFFSLIVLRRGRFVLPATGLALSGLLLVGIYLWTNQAYAASAYLSEHQATLSSILSFTDYFKTDPSRMTLLAEQLHAAVGWTMNDLLTLRLLIHTDPEVFSAEKLATASALYRDFETIFSVQGITSTIRYRIMRMIDGSWFAFLLLIATTISFRWQVVAFGLATILIGLGFLVATEFVLKPLPYRVVLPAFMIMALAIALFRVELSGSLSRKPNTRQINRIGVIAAGIVSTIVFTAAGIQGIRYVANRSAAVQETTSHVRADLLQIQERFGPETKLIIWGNSLNPRYLAQPFSELFVPFIWLNGDNMSGLSQKLFRELGPGDLRMAMCTRDDLLILSNNRGPKDELIERHQRVIADWMQERHGAGIAYREAYRGKGVVAMQCKKAGPL
jgi:hypothetical protein